MRNPPLFWHSEVLAFFRDQMTLPVLLSRTNKYHYLRPNESCDRCPLRANIRHWRWRPRPRREVALWYLHDDPKAWCQLCPGQSVEDVRHILGSCDNDIVLYLLVSHKSTAEPS